MFKAEGGPNAHLYIIAEKHRPTEKQLVHVELDVEERNMEKMWLLYMYYTVLTTIEYRLSLSYK